MNEKYYILFLLMFNCIVAISFNDYMSDLKLENYSDEQQLAVRNELEKLYNVKEKNLQEILDKFHQMTRIKTSKWTIGKSLEEKSFQDNDYKNLTQLKISLDTTSVPEGKKLLQVSSNEYITKTSNGQIFVIKDSKFEELSVLNVWTKSERGCSCKTEPEQNCACCHTKGCVCTSNVETCVMCGLEDETCSNRILKLGSVFGFTKSRESEIVVTAIEEKSLLFFKYAFDLKQLQEIGRPGQRISIDMPNKIESVFYEELLTFDFNGLEKRRFLFIISELGASNSCYEIVVDSEQGNFHLRSVLDFSIKGRNIKVFNLLGKTLIGYVTKDGDLQLREFKVYDNEAFLNQFLQLANFEIETWDYFEVERNYFILLKGKYVVRLLRYDEDEQKFFQHQDISAEGVKVFLPAKVPKGESNLLLIFISERLINFYVWDQSKFSHVHAEKFDEKYALSATSVLSINDTLHLLIASTSGSDLYRLIFLEKESESYVSEEMMERFKNLKGLFDKQIASLETLAQFYESLLDNKMALENSIAREVRKDSFSSVLFSLEDFGKNLNLVKNSLDKAEVFLEDVVPKKGTKKVIEGVKHFFGPKTAIKELVVEYANIGEVFNEEESLSKIVQNLVQIDDERPIEGRKIFGGRTKVRDLHTSTLNGRDIEDFMTVNKPFVVEKATYVNGIKVKGDISLLPFSKVFGVDLSEDLVGLQGHHKLGLCSFKNLITLAGIEVENDVVNSEIFKDFTKSLLISRKDLTFEGSVAFSNMVVKGNLNSNYLMKVKSEDLLSQIISKHENETLSVAIFDAPVYCKELESDRINSEIFPEEFVIKSGSWIDFGLEKYFPKINFKKLSVGRYVNSISTEDLVTKSTAQKVSGLKTFEKGVKILGDLNILASRIDGVDLSVLMKIPDDVETSTIIFEEVVTSPGVIVKGKVNNLILEDVANDLVYKDEFESVIKGRKIFIDDLIFKEGLTSDNINQIDFDNFVNTGEKAIFTAQKTFSNIVNFDNVKIIGRVDDVNLTELFENSVFLDKPYQIVTGKKSFPSISANILNINESLNGKPLVNFLTKTTDQTFPGSIILENASFKNLSTGSVVFYKNGTLNGVSMIDIKRKMEKEGNLDSSVIVKGDVYIAQELQVEKLNGRKTKDLYDLLLRNEKEQLLKGDIDFSDIRVYGSVWTSDFAAGNATFLKKRAGTALRTSEKNFVSGELIWDSIEAAGVNVMGLVNGFKLADIERDSVFTSDPTTFSVEGRKHFLNGFEVDGNLDSKFINGLDLRRHLFSRTEHQTIHHPAHFQHLNLQDVYIKTFNDIDMSLFNFANKKEKTIINGPLTFKGFVHVSSLTLSTNNFGGIDIEKVLDDAVDLRAGKIIITGKKIFDRPPTFKHLNVVTLNDKPLPKLNRNISNFVFDYVVVNGTVTVEGVKTKNLVTMNKNSLLCPSYLRSEFILADDVSDPLIFENLVVYGNMSSNSINGLKLEEEYLTKNTNQSIWVPFNISSMLTNDVFVDGHINGFKIPHEAIAQETTKIISGTLVLKGNIHVPGSLFVKGRFGKDNIEIDDLIILTEDAHFNGKLSFNAPLITTFLKVIDEESTFNGMTLATLDSRFRSFRKFSQNLLRSRNNSFQEALQNTFTSECLKTKKLQSALSDAFVEPHSFVLVSVQEFKGISTASRFFDQTIDKEKSAPVLIFKAASEHWMINSMHFGDCETKLLKWSKAKGSFTAEVSLGDVIGNVHKWMKLDSSDFNKVFLLAVASSEGKCEKNGSTLWMFDLHTFRLEKVQELSSALNAIPFEVNSVPYLYLDSGYSHSLMTFEKDHFELANSDELPKIKLLKLLKKPDGKRLILSYYDDALDIVDGYERRVIYIPNVVGVEIVKTSHDEIIVLISKRKFGLTGEVNLLEAYLYENFNLLSISSLSLEEATFIRPLGIPEDDYDHAMILALSANHPRILTLGGFPFIKNWSEFPTKLNNPLWAYDFVDSDNTFYLCFGDESKIYSIRLEKRGMKYYGQQINCT